MTTITKVTVAQTKTLNTLIANGGEMNGYAGQRGFSVNSIRPLVAAGLVERVASCPTCASHSDTGAHWEPDYTGCERPLHGQRSGQRCYARVRVTEAGREVVA